MTQTRQNSLCLLPAHEEQKLWSTNFTWKVLAVHQLLCISCSMLVSLAQLAGLIKLNGDWFVLNSSPTLFKWRRVCLWIHFKHFIYDSIISVLISGTRQKLTGRRVLLPTVRRQPFTADLDCANVITNAMECLSLQICDCTVYCRREYRIEHMAPKMCLQVCISGSLLCL